MLSGAFAVVATPAQARHHDAVAASSAPSTTPTDESPSLAIPRLEKAMVSQPNDPVLGAQLAEAYRQAKHPDQALQLAERLIRSGQRTAQLFYVDGLANRDLGRNDQALSALQQAEGFDPTSLAVSAALTNLYLETSRLPDALRESHRATVLHPQEEQAFLNDAITLAVARQPEAARQRLSVAEHLAPQDPQPHLIAARIELSLNNPAGAVMHFDDALARDPQNLDALSGKASALAAQHRVGDAIAAFERLYAAVGEPGAKAQVLTQEAQLYVDEHQMDQAEAVLQREISAFPMLEQPHVAYGDLFALEGHRDQAVAQWTIAAGTDQTGRIGISRLGDLALRENRPDEAVARFSRITTLAPSDDFAWLRLGDAALAVRNVTLALKAYQHSFDLRPSPAGLAGVAICSFASGNEREALRLFDILHDRASAYVNAQPRVLYVMGRTYDVAHQVSKARDAYTRLLSYVKHGSHEENRVKSLLLALNHVPASAPRRRSSNTATNHATEASPHH